MPYLVLFSLAYLRLEEQSFGDDLEFIRYILYYFAYSSLPQQGLKVPIDKERNELLKEKKLSLSRKDLCGDILPNEFTTYINYTRSLGFDNKPNYSYLRKLFQCVFRSKGFKYNNVFNQTKKRFEEVCPEASQPKSLHCQRRRH